MKTRTIASAVALGVLLAALGPLPALAADSTVSGTVTLAGAPIGGVEVGWYDPTTDATGETVADANGAYSLTVADGHPYVLYAGIDHNPPASRTGDTVQWKGTGGANYVGVFVGANGSDYLFQGLTSFTTPLSGQNIDLREPGTIAGINPVLANKQLALERLDHDRVRAVRADAAGHFAFLGLIAGRYRVSVSGFRSKADIASYRSPVVTVESGATTNLDPVFEKTGTISGVVTNKGKPVAGVNISSLQNNGYGDFAVTDASGRYTLHRQNPGTWDLYLEPGNDDGGLINRSVLFTHRTAKVIAGGHTRLDIKVRKGGSVTGIIPTTEQQGVQVFIVDAHGALVGGTYVETSAKKPTPFTVRAVTPGAATIFVPAAYRSKTYGSARVIVRAGRVSPVGTIALTKKTVSLSGKVAGASTGTVSFDAAVYGLNSGSAKVKNGRYTITRLLPVPGTVSLASTSTRLGRSYRVTPGLGVTKTVRRGAERPRFSATFVAGGYPLFSEQGDFWLPGHHDTLGGFRVKAGVVSPSRLKPGTATMDLAGFHSASPFVLGSPFYLTIPKSVARVKLKSGTTTNLGTVALTVHR